MYLLIFTILGMFRFDEDNQFYWFNSVSLESEEQYRLIGILLGLAIYNNVILDVRFPMIVYHKLIGCTPVFKDLYSSHPVIAKSLQSMLDFEGTDDEFQDTYMATFSITYSDMFVMVQSTDLKENGDKIPVTLENRQEYVDLYTDWLLNKSIAKQFDAFKKGFDLVMKDKHLADLFTAEEVEMLVCGSKEWDFNSLEENTRYDGFSKSHSVIINFWEVFYEFNEDEKKQLLAFVTGSDRVPVGGLSNLKLVIVKNGPDSDRY
ncbi:PREDICTED: ubiquitin-protein ligase E3A-like, partial [Amphimedon queenslandica]|uniref:HECT-type E3 ubiquitin transferase n=1 Tax=Amphimedon queenslandica TaxID=400682 RepID=A0AAN0IJF0_AMPQE